MNATPTPQRPSLGLALRHAHLRAARLFAEELKPLGLENIHAGIFMHVGLLGMLTQRQLVDSMGVDKSAMVRALDALEARGLVRREAHPTDRRAHAVILTDAGRATLERVMAAVRRTEERMTTGFTPEEAELFHSLVVRFAYPCPDTPPDGSDDVSDEYA
ncbi:MarR family transcriptional regulator [Streptacidiphilus pinicola]|uniref:MarR family transcriptional regulator n=1 Tax=Streptacidiphilus pinicola TaxID=2219663 RepID=A0A2X0K0Z3_9ACTN|nr:MarR family transcriptional regulator [Streptacidiphilus pinicola]RAG82945.1 MarR family transcriptional regulator [Streptacidiphilus pinicola]